MSQVTLVVISLYNFIQNLNVFLLHYMQQKCLVFALTIVALATYVNVVNCYT